MSAFTYDHVPMLKLLQAVHPTATARAKSDIRTHAVQWISADAAFCANNHLAIEVFLKPESSPFNGCMPIEVIDHLVKIPKPTKANPVSQTWQVEVKEPEEWIIHDGNESFVVEAPRHLVHEAKSRSELNEPVETFIKSFWWDEIPAVIDYTHRQMNLIRSSSASNEVIVGDHALASLLPLIKVADTMKIRARTLGLAIEGSVAGSKFTGAVARTNP